MEYGDEFNDDEERDYKKERATATKKGGILKKPKVYDSDENEEESEIEQSEDDAGSENE